MERDQLIGYVAQIIAHDVRLRADAKNIIADTLYEGSFPTGRHSAKRVPGVAGDQTELRGRNAKLLST